jgi:hypothetical protein
MGYIFNELLTNRIGRTTKQAMQLSGYSATVYGPGDYCLYQCVNSDAAKLEHFSPTELAGGVGKLADGLTLASLALFPPAAPVFQGIGIAADSYSFYLTRDLTKLVIDVGLPTISGFGLRSFQSYGQEIGKEAFGQALKEVGGGAYKKRKRLEAGER